MKKERSKIVFFCSLIMIFFFFCAKIVSATTNGDTYTGNCGTWGCASNKIPEFTFDDSNSSGSYGNWFFTRCIIDDGCNTKTSSSSTGESTEQTTGGTTGTATTTTTTTAAATTAVDTTTITKLASTEGTEDLCQSLTASKNIINTSETFTLTATSKNNTDIQTFDFLFFNKDTGKPVKFTAGEYKKNITLTVFKNTLTTDAINYADFLFPDLNWIYYANWPKNIIVEAYLHQSATKWSKFDPACRVELKINSVQPTPIPNPSCVCTSGSCTAAPTCLFDKYETGFTYGAPIKCNLDNSLFFSTPSDANKTGWCQSYLRQKGDANADGKADSLDYFYFVSVKSAGAKIPATVNVDFNGDGNITNEGDRAIIVKSLK